MLTFTATLGAISLNSSFVLYVVIYLAQLIHNASKQHLADLSLTMHCILYASYWLDFLYGFANQLPWQYKTVSCIGLLQIIIQHIQLTAYYYTTRSIHHPEHHPRHPEHHPRHPEHHPRHPEHSEGSPKNSTMPHEMTSELLSSRHYFKINILTITLTIIIAIYYAINAAQLSDHMTQIIGYSSRIGFIIYMLPQIKKNRALQSAQAISIAYIYLSLVLSSLDLTSAWCLNWSWPNKFGSFFTIAFMLMMLYQTKRYCTLKELPLM